MKFWLAFVISSLLIIAMLRQHYAGPQKNEVSKTVLVSQARQGLQEMGNISKDPKALERAISNFMNALQSDPNDPIALFGLGWARQTKGDNQEAERIYSQALIQNNEICKYTHFNLSLILEKNGDLTAALNHAKMAIACDSSFEVAKSRREYLESLLINKPAIKTPGN